MKLAKRFVNINEVAEYLGVSTRTIDRYAKRGLIPCCRFPGKRGQLRFDLEEVNDWMKKRRI